MAFSTSTSGDLSTGININPLIDVLLVLLIIFMVIVPVTSHGLDVAVARAADPAQAVQSQAPVVITIHQLDDLAATYSVDGTPIESGSVVELLRSRLSTRPDRQVLLDADSAVAFGAVAAAADWSRDAGADGVGLMPRGKTLKQARVLLFFTTGTLRG